MKTLPALLFAFAVTALVGVAMLAIGANALLNRNTVPVASTPAAGNVSQVSLTATTQQLNEMQDLVRQYQDRETQYRSELEDAARRLSQADRQVQQYQGLLEELQRRGVIRITSDGQVQVFSGHHDDEDD